jgi:hypothetical protein
MVQFDLVVVTILAFLTYCVFCLGGHVHYRLIEMMPQELSALDGQLECDHLKRKFLLLEIESTETRLRQLNNNLRDIEERIEIVRRAKRPHLNVDIVNLVFEALFPRDSNRSCQEYNMLLAMQTLSRAWAPTVRRFLYRVITGDEIDISHFISKISADPALCNYVRFVDNIWPLKGRLSEFADLLPHVSFKLEMYSNITHLTLLGLDVYHLRTGPAACLWSPSSWKDANIQNVDKYSGSSDKWTTKFPSYCGRAARRRHLSSFPPNSDIRYLIRSPYTFYISEHTAHPRT